MFGFALNQMAKAPFAEFSTTAEALQCVGIEVRNDLGGPLFDGLSAKKAGQAARDANSTTLAPAEVCAFDNDHRLPSHPNTLRASCQFTSADLHPFAA